MQELSSYRCTIYDLRLIRRALEIAGAMASWEAAKGNDSNAIRTYTLQVMDFAGVERGVTKILDEDRPS